MKWEDIDFHNSTYTIKALNNKTRVDMTYHLTNRLKEALKTLGIKDNGYVFTKINNENEPYSAATI